MTTWSRVLAAGVAVAVAFGEVGAAQQPVRDSGSPSAAAGTASISGTVFIAGEGQQPARRVRVTLTDLSRTMPGVTTTTDDRGAFAFQGLPAGRFEIQAFKAAYLRGSYGASRPERPGTPVVVKDGESVTGLALAIARGGVITGAVRDSRGRPVPGVNVRVLRLGYNGVTGERTLGAPSSGSSTQTDDRGEYRAFGLPPGGYLVLMAPATSSGPGSGPGVDDILPLTSADVQRALQFARTGASRTSPTGPASAAPTPGVRVNYAPVFHPGVTDIGAAATVALGGGEERSGVDITMQLVPTATITGRVTDPSGSLPAMLVVQLLSAGPNTEMMAGAGLRGVSAQPAPDGTFVFGGVAPGSYTVSAIVGRARGVVTNAPTKWATADVFVNGRDVDVPLTLQPGVAINGRVVFEGTQPTPAELQTLAFLLVAPGSGGALISNGGGRVNADGRFSFAGMVPGTYQFVRNWTSPGASAKWAIKASVANGREAFESPLRLSPGEPLDWLVTFTDAPTSLAGVFQDPAGRAATDYYMLVFPADRALWIPGSRRIRTTRPGTDGSFSLRGLPPGEYLLSALTDLADGEWNDPTLLEQLVSSSAKVTLRDGQTTTQNFRVGGSRRP